jgi:hypothetical protein
MTRTWVSALVLMLCCALASSGQRQQLGEPSMVVPPLIRFNGVLTDAVDKPPSVVGVTFSLYKDSGGGSPLWMETAANPATQRCLMP